MYRCCVTLKIKREKIWNKNLEKFDQLLPKTLVPKKHRRKIYRGKARFKKWLVTRQSGPRYHFPRWPYTITVYCRPLSRDTMFQPSIYDKGGGGKEKSDEMELHCPSWPVTFFERSVSPPQLWKCNKPETCWRGEKLLQVGVDCNHGYPYTSATSGSGTSIRKSQGNATTPFGSLRICLLLYVPLYLVVCACTRIYLNGEYSWLQIQFWIMAH